MIILASNSARRKEILSFFSIPFIQASPQCNEDSYSRNTSPDLFVEKLAQQKALSLKNQYPDTPILAADTIVYLNNKIYGKPHSHTEASLFLKELSGNTHYVYTGLAIQYKNKMESLSEKTAVTFHALTSKQIETYLNSIQYKDKAGAYAIQQTGGLIVKSIQGCYYNVMGLPLTTLQNLLIKSTGIDRTNI